MKGWLPIHIGFDDQPAIIRNAPVWWLEFGETPLDDPFFEHTVTKLREAIPRPRELETNLATLLRCGELVGPVRPAGFVFHISRCGSTLIANSLRAAGGVQVVSESRALANVLRPFRPASPYLEFRWQKTRRAVADSLFSVFAHHPGGHQRTLVVKFPSVSIVCLRLVRSWWPEVPCLIVVRDPVEVMVASLQSGGGWMSLKENQKLAGEILGAEPVAMSQEEFAARMLGRFLESAVEAFDPGCKVVDYEDLNPARLRAIADSFGIETPHDRQPWNEVTRLYAKDPTRTHMFQPDRERKQKAATPEIREAARKWAMPHYVRLRSL